MKVQFDTVVGDSAATWKLTRAMLHRYHRPQNSDDECRSLADGFSAVFSNKLLQIHQTIIASSLELLPGRIFTVNKYDDSVMSSFAPATADEVRKILVTFLLEPSPLDVFPTALLRSSANLFAPILAHMANLLLAECHFPDAFKMAQVMPLLKKNGIRQDTVVQPLAHIQFAGYIRAVGAGDAAATPSQVV
jgi:hypothetical protein